jgi:N-acetylglucosaminyl-diphospho-decaprenol L-rhamnosyltransferase
MNLAHSDSPSTRTLELSIVVVHYRSWPDTRALAAALVGQIDPGRHEILVVDNSPDEPPPAEGAGPGTRLLSPGRNLGFAGGINFGHAHARGRLLLVLNPDVRPRGGAIAELLAAHERHARAAVLLPRLLDPDGTDQASLRTFYRWETIVAARTPWGRTGPGRRVLAEHLGADLDREREQTVDWGLGAAMLIDPARLSSPAGPLMDDRFFLYLEDVDLCLRAWQAGSEVRYVPSAVFTHQHRRVSHHRAWSRMNLHHLTSLIRFAAKHHGLPQRPARARRDLSHQETAA